jgi:N-acetylneuraminic acid mutarotase
MELDNRGYVGGGTSGTTFFSDKLYEFDPFINLWTVKSTYPFGGRSSQAGISFNGLLYIGFGRISNDCFKDFWSYSPITNTWTQLANFPGVKRIHPIIFVQNGKIVVGSGYTLGSPVLLADYYQFDPVSGTWSPYASPAFSGRSLSAILEFPGDDTYIVSGWDTFENECNEVWNYGLNVSIPVNNFENKIVRIYPNPANTQITIDLENIFNSNYSLFSIHGEVIKKGQLNEINNQIDCSNIPSGLYVLQIVNAKTSVSKKVLIERR